MAKYNPNIHNRRSIRLKGYDYSQAGLYFITICCQNRAHLFGEVVNKKMILNKYGRIAHKEWENSENIRDNIRLHEFIIMPNHIHGIIEILFRKDESRTGELQFAPTEFKSPSHTIGSIIRGYKIATIKKIKDEINSQSRESNTNTGESNSRTGELQFAPTAPTRKIIQLDFKIWQRNYWESIIWDEPTYIRIFDYIRDNPAKWKGDKFYSFR